jgi:hypothetical protein
MPDWIGASGESTARRYRLMAERETHGISPSYEAICLGLAHDDDVLGRLDELPGPKRQPNLLLGAVRFLGGPVSAVTVARADPPTIVPGDLTTDLARVAAGAPDDATLVVFHSAVLAYVPFEGRSAFADEVQYLSDARPTVWLSNEAPGVVAGTETDRSGPARFVLARDGRPMARTGPHGQSLDWLGA